MHYVILHNIRIAVLSPFRKWLDAHNVARPYYEYSADKDNKISFTNLGYPEIEAPSRQFFLTKCFW